MNGDKATNAIPATKNRFQLSLRQSYLKKEILAGQARRADMPQRRGDTESFVAKQQ
jgi:hypothetical protein